MLLHYGVLRTQDNSLLNLLIGSFQLDLIYGLEAAQIIAGQSQVKNATGYQIFRNPNRDIRVIVFLKLSEPLMFTYSIHKVNIVLHGTFLRLKCF